MDFEIVTTKHGRKVAVLHLRVSGVERQHGVTGEWLPRIDFNIGERASDMTRTAVKLMIGDIETRGWVWRDATGETLLVSRIAWLDERGTILSESNGRRGWPSLPKLGPYPMEVRKSAVLVGLNPVALIA